ncbi:hypothetical protein AJ80_00379 [Polytolypa hystricis UAMH7299]|uniref:Serine-threonine protein kinase 19 n=1 Tax=Polytolypa hystricis (strain UAMH7299) TaxID=1447883 RepID=A0A2B7Z3K3_POLH7|nr:hypothetical protein AJ80_00379 [Polytolypa hystricis UAMH7299]
MPLQFTASPSSRIRKSSSTQSSRRASPFARQARVKPFSHQRGKAAEPPLSSAWNDKEKDQEGCFHGDSLPDTGPSAYIADTTVVSSVIQAIQYVRNTMFSDLPETRAGMNSTRIAEVLNFRRSLPPIVSVAHVHMLLNAPTKVEREIVELVDAAVVRRLFIPGRGNAAAGLGDCVILVEDWEDMVRNSASLEDSVKDKFLRSLRTNTKTTAVPTGFFSVDESSALVRAGFLVSSSSLIKQSPITSSIPSIQSGEYTPTNRGQSGTTANTHPARDGTMLLSVPNLGPYLRLLGAARSQILNLLKKSSHGEAPLSLIRDRWDGAVESMDSQFQLAKRARGENFGVLPGRTKKWKELYGMNFRWALEEALGAGLIELFNTGSVGPGVRQV